MITELLPILANKGYYYFNGNTHPVHRSYTNITFSTMPRGKGSSLTIRIQEGSHVVRSQIRGQIERVWHGDTETQLINLIKNEL